ncbi:hypothetical protein [Paenibacillus sediminis]|uniref:Uncharacterized protein n=1 Tax=Paenibacillus sediminis TaxID=664909 RepID=A0ABS4H9E0_9BACL|nr:hypothetical protein [Paenibacillus sediminis]MBP1938665.1 hypothetical protein [Paenibacillus sediminis]
MGSERHFSSREAESAGHILPPNRIAAATSWLKVEGRREYNNVIGNQRKPLKTIKI